MKIADDGDHCHDKLSTDHTLPVRSDVAIVTAVYEATVPVHYFVEARDALIMYCKNHLMSSLPEKDVAVESSVLLVRQTWCT